MKLFSISSIVFIMVIRLNSSDSTFGAIVDRPKDAISAIGKYDADALPSINKLLHILCRMSVTTVCAERSFSYLWLRALKTWLRARMRDESLSGLALLRMHPKRIAQLTWTTFSMIFP